MPTYRVQYVTTASSVVTVEADDPDSARELAGDLFQSPQPCAHCSGMGSSADAGFELSEWEQDETADGVWEA